MATVRPHPHSWELAQNGAQRTAGQGLRSPLTSFRFLPKSHGPKLFFCSFGAGNRVRFLYSLVKFVVSKMDPQMRGIMWVSFPLKPSPLHSPASILIPLPSILTELKDTFKGPSTSPLQNMGCPGWAASLRLLPMETSTFCLTSIPHRSLSVTWLSSSSTPSLLTLHLPQLQSQKWSPFLSHFTSSKRKLTH